MVTLEMKIEVISAYEILSQNLARTLKLADIRYKTLLQGKKKIKRSRKWRKKSKQMNKEEAMSTYVIHCLLLVNLYGFTISYGLT